MSFLPSLFSVSILLCFFCSLNEATTEFDFSTLAISNLKLLGDARLSNGIVSLTRDLSVPNSGAGKVLYANPIRFRQPGTHSRVALDLGYGASVSLRPLLYPPWIGRAFRDEAVFGFDLVLPWLRFATVSGVDVSLSSHMLVPMECLRVMISPSVPALVLVVL
ncbi:hypothetical protein F2Q68_00011272 [Brassica cretica]|uniref:Late embryogenesis abundant protein LEA-2 subgroup domain-containing protein n=1 Tax=Brassica cretica TaxID=69181 RepID=A0A8S9L3R8_BRACR|nr:hypothetical protein F2Q68_00011272 [Brassica cretica]